MREECKNCVNTQACQETFSLCSTQSSGAVGQYRSTGKSQDDQEALNVHVLYCTQQRPSDSDRLMVSLNARKMIVSSFSLQGTHWGIAELNAQRLTD
jgi:hypothetical protein